MTDIQKILILGANSLIGISLTHMLKKKYNIFKTFYSTPISNGIKIDLQNSSTLENAFKISQPDVVINLCGIYKNLNFCEKNQKLVMEINGTSLKKISKLSNQFNSFLISFSSDYVFDGQTGNYKEEDPICPINYYGLTRAEGEKNIQEIANDYSIIRTSMVYGKNSIRQTLPEMILKEIKQKFEVISDQFMTPTYLENLCKMIVEVIEIHYNGILHLAGPEKTSRYEFAQKLLKIFEISNENLIESKRSNFEFSKDMPPDSSLNTNKAYSILKEKPEPLELSLNKYFKSINS